MTLKIFVFDTVSVEKVVEKVKTKVRETIKFVKEQVPSIKQTIQKAFRALAPPVKITISIDKKKGGTE